MHPHAEDSARPRSKTKSLFRERERKASGTVVNQVLNKHQSSVSSYSSDSLLGIEDATVQEGQRSPLKSCQSRDQSLATNEASVLVGCPAENSVLSWSGDPALELSWRASLMRDWRQNPKGMGGASRAGLGRMPGGAPVQRSQERK